MIRLSLQLQNALQPIIFRFIIVQETASGCCNFIAQCIIICRCWIVWGQNIRVVIIPSFLAIAYLATWVVSIGARTSVLGQFLTTPWAVTLTITAFAVSMAVNTLVTGLIVFKIHKVFLQVNATSTSFERTLGSTGGTKLRHVIIIIVESGMALFAIQLVRLVLGNIQLAMGSVDLIIGINQMFNGIAPTIILVRVSMRLSFDDKESFIETAGSLRFNNPPSDPNTLEFRQVGSSSSMPPLERNDSEDIRFNNPPSDSNSTLQRMPVGSSSSHHTSTTSMPP